MIYLQKVPEAAKAYVCPVLLHEAMHLRHALWKDELTKPWLRRFTPSASVDLSDPAQRLAAGFLTDYAASGFTGGCGVIPNRFEGREVVVEDISIRFREEHPNITASARDVATSVSRLPAALGNRIYELTVDPLLSCPGCCSSDYDGDAGYKMSREDVAVTSVWMYYAARYPKPNNSLIASIRANRILRDKLKVLVDFAFLDEDSLWIID